MEILVAVGVNVVVVACKFLKLPVFFYFRLFPIAVRFVPARSLDARRSTSGDLS